MWALCLQIRYALPDRFRDYRIECGRDTKYGVIEGSFSLQPILQPNEYEEIVDSRMLLHPQQADGHFLCALPILSYRFVPAGRIAEYKR